MRCCPTESLHAGGRVCALWYDISRHSDAGVERARHRSDLLSAMKYVCSDALVSMGHVSLGSHFGYIPVGVL